jgi:hypothetical protein
MEAREAIRVWRAAPRLVFPRSTAFKALVAAGDSLVAALERAGREREKVRTLYDRAGQEPLGANISDYSDEYCAGFLDGQANALDFLLSDHG